MADCDNPAQTDAHRFFQPFPLALLGCLVIGPALLVACSSTPKDVRQPEGAKKSLDGTDEQIFVEGTVEKYYHPNVIMKRGEAFFERQEYDESLVEYNHFLDLHRNHALAPYAAFRIGEIHLKRAVTIDRDPDPMQKALAAFERMYRSLEEDRELLRPSQFYEVRYEDLVRDPVGQLQSMYEQLNLGDFEHVRPNLAAQVQRSKDYKTNKYELSDEAKQLVDDRWGDFARRYGYR